MMRTQNKFLFFSKTFEMPANRNALIRFKTIDKCLQNRYRQWTLEDLIDAVSDALYEYEGIDKGVSKRTVQADIQLMRSDKLGYNAPIVVEERKYYTYEDPEYSITNIPLTDQDLGQLSEVIEILKQFKGFSHFEQLGGMVQKLEDHVYAKKTKQKPIIDFEKNENLKGLGYLDFLYQCILKKEALEITYQSFKAKKASPINFHPYLLKEFNNRWFLLGVRKAGQPLTTLALDRIVEIKKNEAVSYVENHDFDPEAYYKDVVGVTVSEGLNPDKVHIFVDKANAPYVLTKPLHPSQEVIEENDRGTIVQIRVKHNFELERLILGFADSMEVLKPARLRRRIREKLERAAAGYEKKN